MPFPRVASRRVAGRGVRAYKAREPESSARRKCPLPDASNRD